MKKIIWIVSLFSLLILAGCNIHTTTSSPTTTSWDVINTTGNMFPVIEYSGELTVAGVGPKVSFEQTIAEDTLALKKNFDDHTDHLFIAREMRSNYLDIQQDALPWDTVKFTGKVKALDAAAGNHYYEVVSIKELKKISTPNKDQVTKLLSQYGYCEKDTDCVGIYGKCPLPCQIAINASFSWVVENIINNFRDAQTPQCTYKCMEIKKVICNNTYTCEIQN